MIARPAFGTDRADAQRLRAAYDLLGALILIGFLAAFLFFAQ